MIGSLLLLSIKPQIHTPVRSVHITKPSSATDHISRQFSRVFTATTDLPSSQSRICISTTMYHSFTSAAALLALLPTTLAAGTAYVVSNCDFDVYYMSVSQGVGATMQKLPSGGYSQAYNLPNDGVSIKIATSPSGPVTQFEFTWDSPNINYDISHINGNPFEAYGSSLVPSDVGASGYPTCVALTCPAGTSVCTDAYNQPDDVQTRVCPESSDLTFTLCPGGSSSNPPSVQSSAQGSAVASSVAVHSSAVPQPAFSVPAVSSASQPAYSVPAAQSSAQPIYSKTTYSQPGFGRTTAAPAAPEASTPTAIPTSFQTFTTPIAKQPVASIPQGQAQAPASSSPVQNSPVAAATTPATQTQAQTQAPAASHTWSWSWGDWHHHDRRAHRVHSHHFRL